MVKGERYMRFLRSGMTRTPPWTGHKIQWIANATQRLYLPLNMIGVVWNWIQRHRISPSCVCKRRACIRSCLTRVPQCTQSLPSARGWRRFPGFHRDPLSQLELLWRSHWLVGAIAFGGWSEAHRLVSPGLEELLQHRRRRCRIPWVEWDAPQTPMCAQHLWGQCRWF